MIKTTDRSVLGENNNTRNSIKNTDRSVLRPLENNIWVNSRGTSAAVRPQGIR